MAPAFFFHNCRVLRSNGRLVRDELWVKDGKVVTADEGRSGVFSRIDCKNLILAPGFIDMQVNGAYGVDFSATKDLPKALAQCSHFYPITGVTSYLPTLITSKPEEYRTRIPQCGYIAGSGTKGSNVLGVHLEGPFISLKKRGCHPPELVTVLEKAAPGHEMDQVHSVYGRNLSNVVMITLAPEYPGAMDAIKELTSQGVIVSQGHSEATCAIGEEGLRHGASCLTHLFSAMNSFGHKEPSLPGLICSRVPVGERSQKLLNMILESRRHKEQGHNTPRLSPLALESQNAKMAAGLLTSNISSMDNSEYCPARLQFGLIADCIHTHPYSLAIAYRLNKHGLVLVTDAISALGLPDGSYHIGETAVEVGGVPRRALKSGTDTLAGVVAPMDECVRNFVRETKCDLAYGLLAASLHPAECLGIEKIKGHLNLGADADMILLDDDVNIHQTWVNGELAYDRETYKPEPIPLEA